MSWLIIILCKNTRGDLVVQHVPTMPQLVDICTKGLSSQQFLFHKSHLSMCSPVELEGVQYDKGTYVM